MSKADWSENEDDPEPFESSGSEWNSDSEYAPKRKGSKQPAKRGRKARRKDESSESDSEASEPKPRKKNGVKKKQKTDSKPQSPEVKKPPSQPATPKSTTITTTTNSKEYSTGSFLILKKDAQVGDRDKHPCIWRVDGKALLQKYEPFEEDGKVKHRTTSVYTGWSSLDRDLYAPVSVTIKQHSNQTLIVDLDWEKLKEIIMDSD